MLGESPSFPSCRRTALERLRRFVPNLGQYARRRNFVLENHSNVSHLSPAIRHRIILESEVIAAALGKYAFGTVEKFVQEVVWRSYWKGWLELRPSVWPDYCRNLKNWKSEGDARVLDRAEAVAAGKSGVAIMDRFARELRETGYLHNHARMWWASFWIHVERLPWELGADYFFRHLLDADPASNTLSWRWVAGLQTPGKTYLVRESNLRRYCPPAWFDDGRGLDRLRDGSVSPVLANEMVRPPLSLDRLGSAHLEMLGTRVGVWVHTDDCLVEQGELADLHPVSVAGFVPRQSYGVVGLSGPRRKHLVAVTRDAVQRAKTHYRCPGDVRQGDCLEDAICSWARENLLDTVVAFAPFVGPLDDRVDKVRGALKRRGIAVRLVRREWDRNLIPLARQGFFPFWQAARERYWKTSRTEERAQSGQAELPFVGRRS